MASEARVAQLKTRIAELEKERDELAADVERLCLQSGSSMFDPSYLLTERLRVAETEARTLRQQLSALTEERDTILEELHQARTARISSEAEQSCLSERVKSMERDVTFYKERAIKAMAERDQEIENIRVEALGSEARLREMARSLELAQASKNNLEARLGDLQAELDAVRHQHLESEKQRAASAEAEAELRQLRDTMQQLEDGTQKLKAQLAEVQAEASHTHKLLKQAHKIEDQLTGQVRELQAELATFKRQHSSGGQSPQSRSPTGSRSQPESVSGTSPAGSVGGAAAEEPGATSAGARSPAEEAPQPPPPPASASPSLPSTSASPAAAARAAAAPPPPSPRSSATAPRGGGGAAARSLSAAIAAAVTVTAAEAAAPDHPPPLHQPEPPPAPSQSQPLADEVPRARNDGGEAASRPSASAAMEAPAPLDAGGDEAAGPTHGSLRNRVRELEAALAQARDELSLERAVHEDEREQLQVLRTMAHDFKIKLAQATQEKVEALMRAAQLTQFAASAGVGGAGPPLPAPTPQRQASVSSERSSRDLSRSPGSSFGLFPATSAPVPQAGAAGGQPSAKSLWAAWLGGSGGGWYATPSGATAPSPPPPPTAATAAPTGGSPQYAASVASEEGSEAAGASAAAAAATAAAAAAAHAATVEAAEGRSRRLASQLERLRSQLAAIDRLAGQVGRCEARLRGCAALLWSSREEDAPRRWAALGDLNRLAEECSALRADACLPPPPTATAPPAGPAAAAADPLPPVIPLALAEASGALRDHHNHHRYDHQQQHRQQQHHAGSEGHGGGDGGGEYDASLVCTREAGGVQRRVAEVLLSSVEFGVRSLEQYNHQSAMSSVLYS